MCIILNNIIANYSMYWLLLRHVSASFLGHLYGGPWRWPRNETEAYRSNNLYIKISCNKLVWSIIYLILHLHSHFLSLISSKWSLPKNARNLLLWNSVQKVMRTVVWAASFNKNFTFLSHKTGSAFRNTQIGRPQNKHSQIKWLHDEIMRLE